MKVGRQLRKITGRRKGGAQLASAIEACWRQVRAHTLPAEATMRPRLKEPNLLSEDEVPGGPIQRLHIDALEVL